MLATAGVDDVTVLPKTHEQARSEGHHNGICSVFTPVTHDVNVLHKTKSFQEEVQKKPF